MGKRGIPPTVDWTKVNWSKQDIVLAEDLGLSRERIRQMRKVLRKPKPKHERCRRISAYIKLSKVKTIKLTLKQIAKKYGYTEGHVRNVLERLGKGFFPEDRRTNGKYEWASITKKQWQSLTDREIAVKLGVENPAVVTLWRIRHDIYKKPRRTLVEKSVEQAPVRTQKKRKLVCRVAKK